MVDISVIVPVYNVEKYLKKCIDTILAQTFQNFELILVDDGSTDNSGKICDDYKELDVRIKVIHKKNGGLSSARNEGIKISNGEYIAFIDSDDYVEEKYLECLFNTTKKYNSKLTICSLYCEDSNYRLLDLNNFNPLTDGLYDAKEIIDRMMGKQGWYFVVAWNKLYHRSLLNDCFYPINKFHEDQFVIVNLLWNASSIACTSFCGYHYILKREGSITSSVSQIKHMDELEALYNRSLFYVKNNYKKYLINDRNYFYIKMEEYSLNKPKHENEYKIRLKEIELMYSKFPEKTVKEKIRFLIYKINPKLAYYYRKVLNKIGG